MKIKLFTTKSSENILSKTLENEHDFTITFNQEIDLREPIIEIYTTVDLRIYNYAYFTEFDRYYYIDTNSIECISDGYYRIHLKTDVLMTYKEDILKCSALIYRQERKVQKYIIDRNKPQYAYKNIVTKAFPNEITNDNFSYVLITA